MGTKDKTKIDGGPTLFDGLDPQDTQAVEWDALNTDEDVTDEERESTYKLLRETRDEAAKAGIYMLLPTETLARRGELYYNQHVGVIRKTLASAGAAPDVINVVCKDYAAALFGDYRFTATPEQMQAATTALPPVVAFNIDRYALYCGVLLNYARYLLRYQDYTQAVKGEAATEETKRAIMAGFYSGMDARAMGWLIKRGYVEPSDFAGFDPAEVNTFFRNILLYGFVGEYAIYYFIAKYALLANAQELAEIDPPPIDINTPLVEFAEQAAEQSIELLNRSAKIFAEAVTLDASTTEREQARQAGEDWHDKTNADVIKIHQNYGLVLSRPVNISPNGEEITKTFPVRLYIEDFTRKYPEYAGITETTVQKVIEGVNLLPTYLNAQMTIGENGRYSFLTNITKFSEICGYVDANQDEKTALLGGLRMLDNLYFVVNKPKRFEEYKDRKGRKRRQQVGGMVAMRFLVIREFGLETGHLRIEVYPESLKGRPTLINQHTYRQLRAEAKGLTQSRFNFQIATKSHKSERDLIDEVFGFADMLKYATPEELPKVTKYVQGHRGRERERLLGWFEQYVKAGIITNFKREPSKTDKRDFVLSWVCPDPSKLSPPPFDPNAQEPDVQ